MAKVKKPLLLVFLGVVCLLVGLFLILCHQTKEKPPVEEVEPEKEAVSPPQKEVGKGVPQPYGGETTFWVGKIVACPSCGGDGWVSCPECKGTGYIEENTFLGAARFICPTCRAWRHITGGGLVPCNYCGGRGEIPVRVLSNSPYSDPRLKVCPDCAGKGLVYNIYAGRYQHCHKCWGSGWTFLDIP